MTQRFVNFASYIQVVNFKKKEDEKMGIEIKKTVKKNF